MNSEIKELFNKYGVKDLKDKHGQSECFNCKNIKHRYSLTWTSFLYEYKEDYYCFDCLLTMLLQKENNQLKEQLNGVREEREYLFNKLSIENNNLQQENNQLKLDFELYKDNHIYKNYEVERKDIVIKELRSWLEEQYLRSDDYSDYETTFKMVLNKLNELEGKND